MVPLPQLGTTVQAVTLFLKELPIEKDVFVRRVSVVSVMPPAGGVTSVPDTLVTEPRTLEVFEVTEDANLVDAGANLSLVLFEPVLDPVPVLSVPTLVAAKIKTEVTSALPVTGQRSVSRDGVRTSSMRKGTALLVSDPASVLDAAPVRKRVGQRQRHLRRYVLPFSLPKARFLVVSSVVTESAACFACGSRW